MSKVRLDRYAPIKLGATPLEITPEGYHVYEGTAAFGDVVHDYPEDNPPISEFRPSDEALSDATLLSAKGKLVTWDHPDPNHTPQGLLLASTSRDHFEGIILDAWRADDRFMVKVMIHTPELLEEIQSGAVELSLGYWRDPDLTAGEFQGRRYDVVQRNLRVNHLAVVPRGKNARSVRPDGERARLDAPSIGEKSTVYPPIAGPENTMKKLRIDALALSPEAQALLAQMPEADRALLMASEEEDAEVEAGEEDAEKEEDVAQDEAMLAPLIERITKLEELIAGLQGAAKDAPPMKKPARTDASPTIDVDAIIAKAKAQAVAEIEANQKFVSQVRVDGVHTATDAAAHMLATIKDCQPELHEMALDALKGGRLDSLTALYKSSERSRRDRAAEDRFTQGVLPQVAEQVSEPLPLFLD